MDIKDIASKLRIRLEAALPTDRNDDGCYGTDGSYQALYHLFERAFDRAAAVADSAIAVLEDLAKRERK